MSQFASTAPSKHHRVSRRFLDAAHPQSLRSDIDRMSDDGTGMSAKLTAAVRSLSWVPLDDCVCEGPHAQAKRIKMPAACAKWTWIAASMRLGQHISDCTTLVRDSGSLRTVWSNFASVVQPASKSSKTPRMKPLVFQRRLYRLDHLQGFPDRPGSGSAALVGQGC